MGKNSFVYLFGRVAVEVLLFCSLTGCAYAATEQVLPQLESSVEWEESVEVEENTPIPSTAPAAVEEEKRVMNSIPVEEVFGEDGTLIPELTFEEAKEQGNIIFQLEASFEEEGLGGLLPGLGEGIWYGIDVDGITYIYGYYKEIDRTDFFTYVILEEMYELGNGLRVGLTGEEAASLCPELVRVDLNLEDMYWNGIEYPQCWIEQLAAISPYCPTAS